MLRVVEAVVEYVDEVFNLHRWWSEWNTRHSPVAFWLAVVTALFLLVVTVLYAREAWLHLRGLVEGS